MADDSVINSDTAPQNVETPPQVPVVTPTESAQQNPFPSSSPLAGPAAQTAPLSQPSLPAPSVVVPQSTVDNRSFTTRLLGGLLSGLAGGASANPYSNDGGKLGLANQQQFEKNQQDQLQQQNHQQQQQFEDQLATQQNDRANQTQSNSNDMHKIQMAIANNNQLITAHNVALLPVEDQVKFQNAATDLVTKSQEAGHPTVSIPDTPSAMTAYFQANPNSTAANTMFVHIHNPNDGQPGQVIAIGTAQASKPLDMQDMRNILHKLGSNALDGFPNTATVTTQDFNKIFQEAQKNQSAKDLATMREQGENQRNAANINKDYGVARINQQTKEQVATGGPANEQADASKVESLHSGNATTADFTSGMGSAKEVKRLTDAWLIKYPQDANKVDVFRQQAKVGQDRATNSLLQSGRTLFAPGGAIDQVQQVMQKIPRSQIPILSKYLQTGDYNVGGASMGPLLSTLPDVQDLLAKFNTGNGNQTSDLRIKQAMSQIRAADTPEQLTQSLQALKQLGFARYRGIVNDGGLENKFLTNRYAPGDFGAQTRIDPRTKATYTQGADGQWHLQQQTNP